MRLGEIEFAATTNTYYVLCIKYASYSSSSSGEHSSIHTNVSERAKETCSSTTSYIHMGLLNHQFEEYRFLCKGY